MEPEKYLVWWDTYGMDRDDFVVELGVMQRAELMERLDKMCDGGIIDDWGVQSVGYTTAPYSTIIALLDQIEEEHEC